MERSTNALAKLAKRLDTRKSKDFIPHVDGYDVYLARRIIAELAKVANRIIREGTMLMYTPEDRMAIISAVDNCRAIAEEGEAK